MRLVCWIVGSFSNSFNYNLSYLMIYKRRIHLTIFNLYLLSGKWFLVLVIQKK